MSQRIGKVVIITQESPQKRELCGAIAETRPYGPKGEEICFDCGMKDPAGTMRRTKKVLFGEDTPMAS